MANYSTITQQEIQKIETLYGISISKCLPIKGGNSNSSFRLFTDESEYVLTIVEEKEIKEIENLVNLLLHLEKNQFPSSEILKALNGKPFAELNSKPVIIKKWIEGDVSRDFKKNTLEEIGNSMANLHQIPACDFLPKKHSYGIQEISKIKDLKIDVKYENWLQEKIEFLKNNIPENLPKGLIHGDLFFDNLLLENNKLKAIIDFEEACNYYLVFDLGMSIIGLCMNGEEIDLVKVKHFIKGYEAIRKLEPLEKEKLMLFTGYAAIATSYWRFWKYNIQASVADSKNKHWEMVRITNNAQALQKKELDIVFSD